jgi:flagellar export protein FliJ
MSRALDTLIRLHKERIDEVQLAVAKVQEERRALGARGDMLAAQLAAEQVFADRDPMLAATYGAYAPRIMAARTALAAEDTVLAAREETLRDAVSEAFIEMKKLEHLRTEQAERERLAENARELASLDEAAIIRAARRD